MTSPTDKPSHGATVLQSVATSVQVISIAVAALLSVLSFNSARGSESEARIAEARKHDIEAARPFLELRTQTYLETLKVVGVLATSNDKAVLETARQRFEQLYWAELALVEDVAVDNAMVALREALQATDRDRQQKATLQLAHAVRDSLALSWGMPTKALGRVY